IDIPASSRPIWVKSQDGSRILYQRRNNSTRQVPHKETTQFITERFGNQQASEPLRRKTARWQRTR
ncbi:MAG: hypothetical protein OXB90_01420, partial [Acidimicrobiaceae bacterium]|nr:hypothetical protein [Acidimicrobiaceae bacterium]